jgi:hypothetical protein
VLGLVLLSTFMACPTKAFASAGSATPISNVSPGNTDLAYRQIGAEHCRVIGAIRPFITPLTKLGVLPTENAIDHAPLPTA